MARNNPYALKFNGNDSGIMLPASCSLYDQSFTKMFWINRYDSTRGIIVGSYRVSGGAGVNLEFKTDNTLRVWWNGDPDINTNIETPLNQWFHITWVRDKNNDKQYIYVNGDLKWGYNSSLTDKTNTVGDWIGRDDRTGETVFNGLIDNVSIWNKALTPEEVKYYMNRRLDGDEEGLVGYWPLDEGQGNITHDLSPYQNHGTIYNAEWVEGEVDLAKYSTLENINISKTNIWYTDIGNINLSCSVSHLDGKSIQYKLLVNGEEVIPLSQSYPTPAELDISVPINAFTDHENLLQLIIVDEGEEDARFSYVIKKENRDTFTFKRIFDFKEDYITDENIEVIYGRGLTLKEIGRGEVNIEIPTEGKSKIKNIGVNSIEDIQEELVIDSPMTYIKDLGAGKVYEGRLLTGYSDITNIDII